MLVIGSLLISVLLISGVSFRLWHNHRTHLRTSSSAQTLGESSKSNTPTAPTDASSSGLTFQNSDSGSTAQTPPGAATPTAPATSLPAIDPATFGQYDKYKNDDQALFAEIQAGTGAELTADKRAAVLYKGWLTNGQLFDASRPDSSGKLQAFDFTLGAHQVISGWEQGLAGMKVGGTRLLIVPPSVGYGASGQGPIPGNSVLVFQVQLLAVQ